MAFRIAFVIKDSGRFRAGDCIEAHEQTHYMGSSVESPGGILRILNITDGDIEDNIVYDVTSPWTVENPDWDERDGESYRYIPHPTYNRRLHISELLYKGILSAELDRVGVADISMSQFVEGVVNRDG